MTHLPFPCARPATIAAAFAGLMCMAPPACGQPLFGRMDSMEWMAADSSLIARGTIEALSMEKERDRGLWHSVTFRVAETLKGEHRPAIQFMMQSNDVPSEIELIDRWQSRKPELLVFLHESKCLVARDNPRYARCDFAPRTGRRDGSVLVLDSNGTSVFTLAHDALSQPEEIIRATKAAVAVRQERTKLCSHSFMLPHDLVRETPWAQTGGGVKLSVPIDARLEAQARQWIKSQDGPQRVKGAQALIYFRSEANAAALKALLDDGYSSQRVEHHQDRVERELVYGVREAAVTVLEAWCYERPQVIIREPLPPTPTDPSEPP